MFRSDRDALAQQVEEMREEQAQLRAQNDAMRRDLLARRQQVPDARGGIGVHGNVYKTGIDELTPGDRAALAHHELEAFPVWATLLLHYLTLGLFSLVHISSLHGRLPQAERDDPSAAKAVGFSFIPYFNLYWVFFNPLRLADRINLQLRLRGLPAGVPRGLVLTCSVVSMIPYLGWLLGVFVLWPIAVAYFRSAANTLAALPRDGAEAEAVAVREQAPGLRVPAMEERVRVSPAQDLRDAEEAAIEREAELEADEAARGHEPRDRVG
jgi:hypothetical protein